MFVTQIDAYAIEQENIRQKRYRDRFLPGVKVGKRTEVSKLRSRETRRRNASMPLEFQVFKALDEMLIDIKWKSGDEELSNYKQGIYKTIEKCKEELKDEGSLCKAGLISLFEECGKKRTVFKKRLYKKLTPGYADYEVQRKIEDIFSYRGKNSGDIMFKSKGFLEGREYSRPISKCRDDSYMFANHKLYPDNPSSLVISKIAFDFDKPTNLLPGILSEIPLNVIVMDKAELEKTEMNGRTKKTRKKDGKMYNIGDKNKAHGFILLKDPVFTFHEKSYRYYLDTRIRLVSYLNSRGLEDDPHGGKIVAKNIANTNLYQSFLVSDKKWTLQELNETLDRLNIPQAREICKTRKELFVTCKGKGLISEGLEQGSRNCFLYYIGIHSKTNSFNELLTFLQRRNTNFSIPLPAKEVRKIANSIERNSFVWKNKIEKRVNVKTERLEQNYAQLMGTLSQMSKNERRIEFIKSVLSSYHPRASKITIARDVQLLIQEHLDERLSIEYLRKLVSRVDRWRKRYKELSVLRESVSFQSVRDWLFRIEKGIITGLNHILKSYILYKLRNFGRYYKGFNIELILKFLSYSPKTVHSLAQIYNTNNQKLQV